MVVAQQCLVDLGAVGVWYVGELGLAVAGGVEAFIADMADVVGFYQARKTVPLAALETDASAQGLRVGVVLGVVFIDKLIAVTRIHNRFAAADQVAKLFVSNGLRATACNSQSQQGKLQCFHGTYLIKGNRNSGALALRAIASNNFSRLQ